MIALDDYEELKRKVERLERRGAEAEGALKQILSRLKTEFGCASVEEAHALLDRLKKKEVAAHAAYIKAKKRFERKFRKELKIKK